MKNNIHDLRRYSFQKGERFLLDTNIWLFLFPPPGNPNPKVVAQYSSGFARIRAARSDVVMEPTVLGEYANRYARIEYEAVKSGFKDYKAFRRSKTFSLVGNKVRLNLTKILGFCTSCDIPFASFDMPSLLASFESGELDISDGLLLETCKNCGLKLVTNDSDFREGGIDVLTTNPTLLHI